MPNDTQRIEFITGRERRRRYTAHEKVRFVEETMQLGMAFAIDTHDRKVIAWAASTGGVTGQMVRDLMLACVEARFGGLRATHPVQWLADNGSAFTAAETLAFAAAQGLVPRFTPVRSPETNLVSEAFVRPLKRDYARVQPRPDTDTVLARVGAWITDYNEHHPHRGLGMRSPRGLSVLRCNKPHVRFDGGNSIHINLASRN